MKKIFLIKQEILPKGGLEKYAKKLTEAFVKKGCTVLVISSTPGVPMFGGVPVVSLPCHGLFGFQRLRQWDKATSAFVKQTNPNVILTLDRVTCPTHIRAGNGVHAAFLDRRRESFLKRLSFRMNPLHTTLIDLEKRGFTSPSLRKIIVNSYMVQKEIEQHYTVDPRKIVVHHNGVEWHEMAQNFERWKEIRVELLDKLALPKEEFYFLFAGHHYRRKGLDLILNGLAQIKTGHLLVVGKDRETRRYAALVKKLNLQHRVHFLGARSDMNHLYAASDALAVPSLYDPFANVTVEALAMGLFVVSSKYNGGHEVLLSLNGAVIEDLFDPDSVAKSLSIALAHPKTSESAETIRSSVSSLDFSIQLPRFVEECLT